MGYTYLRDTNDPIILHEQTDPNYDSNKHPGGPRFIKANFSDDKKVYCKVDIIRKNKH